MNKQLSSLLERFFGMRAGMFYVFLFLVAIGVATFVENDFGTSAAQKWIYQATWFEVLLTLFCGAIIYNISHYRLIQRKQWPTLTFHLAMIVILIGAGITRIFGYEGTILILEGETEDTFYSREQYINVDLEIDNRYFTIHEPVLFSSLGKNDFDKEYEVAGSTVRIKLNEFVPNPKEVVEPAEGGVDMIKVVIAGGNGRQETYLARGERRQLGSTFFSFEGGSGDFEIAGPLDSLMFRSSMPISRRTMATGDVDTIQSGEWSSMKFLSLHQASNPNVRPFVFSGYEASAVRKIESDDIKVKNDSEVALRMTITVDDDTQQRWIQARPALAPSPESFQFRSAAMQLSYGSMAKKLPFAIKLYDFQMERYPGTESPASFASEVRLIDTERNHEEDFRIYMNNILNYRGYRFFQASYTRDERGTFLSVNHDEAGTWVSYIGYALLTLGMIWSLLFKQNRFRSLLRDISKNRNSTIALLVFASSFAFAQDVQAQLHVPSEAHARMFSELIVQDFKGRMKPMHTLTREIMRKVHGSESYQGYNADQVILGMYSSPNLWYAEPVIKVGEEVQANPELGFDSKYIGYADLFFEDGSYKLVDLVRVANEKAPIDKNAFDKAIVRLDESVNVLNAVFSGRMLRIFPIEGAPNNEWSGGQTHGSEMSEMALAFFQNYRQQINHGIEDGHYSNANALVSRLDEYQREHGAEVIPSDNQRAMEIKLNEWLIFNRLAPLYSLLGLSFMVLMFRSVLFPNRSNKWGWRILMTIVTLAFAFHTFGLGVRWYVSERAPWSNGYETMLLVSWAATFVGLLLARKRLYGGQAAANVLAGVLLLIAMMSRLNPEITPLVPVLNSYWLSIHVSMIVSSYGFLMLGAVIGIMNLMLLSILRASSLERIKSSVKDLTRLSEVIITAGLFMLSIGTYLGGVWANESWGRYWGWDAKETWALVTILVYAFILHMRFIPNLKGVYAFNVATLFGLASVIMTYYGVNYFLSGLHSYAAGEPQQIPSWAFISLGCVFVLSLIAYFQKRRLWKSDFGV